MHAYRHTITLLALIGIVFLRTSFVYAGEVRVPIGSFGGGIELTMEVKSLKELRENGVALQQLDYSCGSAALATIFTSYLNMPTSEADVINDIVKAGNGKMIAERKGFSLLDLKKFADGKGVTATGYKLDLDLIQTFKAPVMVPLFIKQQNQRHFVIYLGEREGRIFLADPAMGRRTLSRDEFLAQWEPRIGMVFTRPGTPPLEQTALAIRPEDDTRLSAALVMSLALQASFPYLHFANEF